MRKENKLSPRDLHLTVANNNLIVLIFHGVLNLTEMDFQCFLHNFRSTFRFSDKKVCMKQTYYDHNKRSYRTDSPGKHSNRIMVQRKQRFSSVWIKKNFQKHVILLYFR